jgi:two-component system sensor histidine kinase DegS
MTLPSEIADQEELSIWEKLKKDCRIELEETQKELKEIVMLIEQSQLEISRIQQRNASISTHLQQIQTQFESASKADIRMAYDAALDAQQRLFVMRGQIDKLQSDHNHIDHYLSILERVNQVLETGGIDQNGDKKDQMRSRCDYST